MTCTSFFFFFDKTSQIEKEPEQTDNDIGGHAVRALTCELLNFIFLKLHFRYEFVRVCVKEDRDRESSCVVVSV